jgi:hypothetical protein
VDVAKYKECIAIKQRKYYGFASKDNANGEICITIVAILKRFHQKRDNFWI